MIRPWRWKAGVMLALALVCGPNVLLLLPSWLLGALCYRYGRAVRVPRIAAASGLVAVLAVMILSYPFLPDWPYAAFNAPFFYSAAFVSALLFGMLVTLLIWFFDQAFHAALISERLDRNVRWLADHTFSLYLYHFPLLFFVGAVVPFDHTEAPVIAGMIVLVLALILGLSVFTESKRDLWRKAFSRIWDGAASRLRSAPS